MIDLGYLADSFAGPVDERVVERLSRDHGLDPDYVAHQREHHGGIPTVALFDTPSGTYCVARFLTLLDSRSKPPGPHRPHFESAQRDERVVRSVSWLVDGEHATSKALLARRSWSCSRCPALTRAAR
ncbi:MAG: hypothetical protein AB7T09_16910 [Planctomycetota bacterium]